MIRPEHRGAYPRAVERDPASKSLRIEWADGHVSDLSYDRLRGYCPCAGCQGHSGSVEFQSDAVGRTQAVDRTVGRADSRADAGADC